MQQACPRDGIILVDEKTEKLKEFAIACFC